jgi:hypothetical protein
MDALISSASMPACLKVERNVPGAISECIGTMTVRDSRRSLTWLPRWLTWAKPKRPSARSKAMCASRVSAAAARPGGCLFPEDLEHGLHVVGRDRGPDDPADVQRDGARLLRSVAVQVEVVRR